MWCLKKYKHHVKVKIMDKEKIKEYMLYGIDGEITFIQCLKNEVIIIIFSMLSIWLGKGNTIFLILNLVPVLVHFVSVLKLRVGNTIEEEFFILYNGIFLVCLSYVFAMLSFELVFDLFDRNARGLVIDMMILGYIVILMLYRYTIGKLIRKNAYSGNVKKLKSRLFFSGFGLLGISVGKFFFTKMNKRSGKELVCIFFLLLSYLFFAGVFNIFKYIYLMKHKELLEELDGDIKEEG